MIKVKIKKKGRIPVDIKISYNTDPQFFIKEQYLKNTEWGIDYDTVPKNLRKDWFATDIFWRLFRALSNGTPIIIGRKIYRIKNPKDRDEIFKTIFHISRLLDKFRDRYWLDEQNKDFVTVIFRQ